jgi:hypothetical protein
VPTGPVCRPRSATLGLVAAGVTVLALVAASSSAVLAQGAWSNAPRNPVCGRLEAQLASLGQSDPRAAELRRHEEAAARQQQELDRIAAQGRRMGCEGSGFFLFGGGVPPQCDQINGQIRQMRGNLERIRATMRQLQGAGGADREDQRRAILAALAQNDCGPQYRSAAAPPPAQRPRGFLETLFGAPNQAAPPPDEGGVPGGDPTQQGSGYRTVCVRSCDGFFFPISYSTNQSRFQTDERICQRMCPATEVSLYTYRNPGEDIGQAVSVSGQPYTQHPNAFRYRQAFDASCTCKPANQSWAEAVPDDQVERGDIVVTEERARTLSQPKAEPQRPAPRQPPPRESRRRGTPAQPQAAQATTGSTEPASAPTETPPAAPPTGGSPAPRSVGPQFYR